GGCKPAPCAGHDLAGSGDADVPGGAAPHGAVAPRICRRIAGHGVARSGEGGPEPVPGQLPDLPEAVRRAVDRADPDAVDLPGLGGDPAWGIAGILAGGVPLPARVDALAARI